MKATINELWETGRQVLSYDDDEYSHPTTISDLKQCNNVLVGDKFEGGGHEVLIDNSLFIVTPAKVHHPGGGGTIYILEVF